MRVLAIESSCDETAVAVYDETAGLLAHQLYSQVALHARYGGVVPELASRDHIKRGVPLLRAALAEAQCDLTHIHAVAYTKGPGLVGSLLVGATLAKSLAWTHQWPCIGVHHLEAHLMANLLVPNPPEYPYLALLVSGGHTVLIVVNAFADYQLIGETLDDAAGEAFDKTAVLLGLGYPGGAALSRCAEDGDSRRFAFPRPMCDQPNFNFSFSGLKTRVRQCVEAEMDSDLTLTATCRADIAASFQAAVVDTLLIKCERALQHYGLTRLVMAGGVCANQLLRAQADHRLSARGIQVFYPPIEWCTDNAAMVAVTGLQRLLRGERDMDWAIDVRARWPLSSC